MENKENSTKLILPQPVHFGYVTRDIERSIKNLERYFGLVKILRKTPSYFNKTYHGKPEDFEMQFAYCRVGSLVYEFIQTIRGSTVYDEFLKEHGEGIHHLGYEVENLSEWIEAYGKVGIRPIMTAERVGAKFAYFSTPEIIVELVQLSPEARIL